MNATADLGPQLQLEPPPVVTVVSIPSINGIAVEAQSSDSTTVWQFIVLPEQDDIYYGHRTLEGKWSPLLRMARPAWQRFGACPHTPRELHSFARWFLGGRPDLPRGKHEGGR